MNPVRRTALLTGVLAPAIGLPLWVLWDPETVDEVVAWASILSFSVGWLSAVSTLVSGRTDRSYPSATALDDQALHLSHQISRDVGSSLSALLGAGRATVDTEFTANPSTGPGRPTSKIKRGTLSTAGRFFSELPEQRLVVLGDAGSGKSFFLNELVLQILGASTTQPPTKVPLLLNAARWDLQQPLTRWITDELVQHFALPRRSAEALLLAGRVLPLIDGLDELDTGCDSPRRAARAVALINQHIDGRRLAPVVVSCRYDTYATLQHLCCTAVRQAREIILEPMKPADVQNFLAQEYSTPADVGGLKEWRRALARSAEERERFLGALASPWFLAMAVAFQRGDGDLTTLRPTADEVFPVPTATQDLYAQRLRHLLLSGFVPAQARRFPSDGYTAAEVTRWCSTLASHLQAGEGITLHQWCPPRWALRVRVWSALLSAGLVALATLAACAANAGIPNLMHDIAAVARVMGSGRTSEDTMRDVFGGIWP